MAEYFWLRAPAIALADKSLALRSSNGFKVTKTIPALELLVKPLIDRPGKATALSTPGCLSAVSLILRMTVSVRSKDAPFGN
ncbi:hypothetical protein D3C80_1723780 [compost metagenome]